MTLSAAAQYGAQHLTRGIGRLSQHVFVEGRGSYLTTDTGKRLLDMTSGIGVVNLGHCHPAVTRAAQEQCGKLTHAQLNIGFNGPQIELLRALQPIMPDPSLDTFFLWNSGSEAVEAAVKVARRSTGRPNIIVAQGSYHGRTAATAAMTRSKTLYGEGVGPLMPGVFSMAFPYYSQMCMPHDTPTDTLVDVALQRVRLLLQQETAPRDTAAILLEPVLGEGGYVPAPPAYLAGLREICDEHGMLLIVDEVQSGFGRTGKMFAIEHAGVRPDMVVFAKGIANGYPLSGIVASKATMDAMPPGSMGGTYAGNAVACAAAQATIQAFRDERVLDNVAARHTELLEGLDALRAMPVGALIEDVRGHGLMMGVQFRAPRPIASALTQACLERGMLLLSTSAFDAVRWIPPLTVSREELAQALGIFKDALEAVAHAEGCL
ncbi:4-aminobutyrate--2-oxoglutarate transaminase [Malassezia caprae]|uniref:4-aminobutyrate--2-oxoglutarate transaminase n=1 Tax=Malassezia caprae TaxID=1381934 RepID=A0AAF0IZE8_9BASI|nr:4-aminobutyrate--2-oxoglutarate transaminase [Malassezia caprae]